MITITLRNPLTKKDPFKIYIRINSSKIAEDWKNALIQELKNKTPLEKNYCWLGWPNSLRNLKFLVKELNVHIDRINQQLSHYSFIPMIDESTICSPITGIDRDGQRGGDVNHAILNQIHNHFEILQGTVNNMSDWYLQADELTKYSIRQLNLLCHEIESLCPSLRKQAYPSQRSKLRASQITTFLNATRYKLTPEHRNDFLTNGYNRKFGCVYLHWSQIGKTLYEVFRDENGIDIDKTVCDAITHLEYYSGSFDIEWGRDVVYGGDNKWHNEEIQAFNDWLIKNNFDPTDPNLSLGYIELGKIDLLRTFGSNKLDDNNINFYRNIVENRLDIYSIQVDDVVNYYDYVWTDDDYINQQLNFLKPGYNNV